MIQSGLDLDFDLTSMAVMGFAEVLPKLREFFRLAARAEQCFANNEVDGVVLVDFPGFNWHIAKRAKKYGIPVFYYLPPQLWAWGGWRVRKMRKYVDHVFCNLPFETLGSRNMACPQPTLATPSLIALPNNDLIHGLSNDIDATTKSRSRYCLVREITK